MSFKAFIAELATVVFYSFIPIYLVASANDISLFDPKVVAYLEAGLANKEVLLFLALLCGILAMLIKIKKGTWLLGKSKKNSFLTNLFEGSAGSIRTIYNFCTAALFISSVVLFKGHDYVRGVASLLTAVLFLVITSVFASQKNL